MYSYVGNIAVHRCTYRISKTLVRSRDAHNERKHPLMSWMNKVPVSQSTMKCHKGSDMRRRGDMR